MAKDTAFNQWLQTMTEGLSEVGSAVVEKFFGGDVMSDREYQLAKAEIEAQADIVADANGLDAGTRSALKAAAMNGLRGAKARAQASKTTIGQTRYGGTAAPAASGPSTGLVLGAAAVVGLLFMAGGQRPDTGRPR